MPIEIAEFSSDYFARMAELEDRHPWTRHMRILTFALLSRAGGDSCQKRVDVGCGTGLFLEEWRRRGQPARMTGLDFAYPALEYARTRTKAEWVAASAAALPLGTGSFDALHTADVLQHLAIGDVTPAFQEIARVLRPGGLAALRLRGPRWLTATPDVDYSVTFTTTQVRQQLERCGFDVVYLSRVNALPSLAAEIRDWLSKSASRGQAPVKGIACHGAGDPRSAGLAIYLRLEKLWSFTLGLPLPFGHTILCVARKRQS
ncbi:MAG: class I SAM-dependent methyltransferase [Bryobacterales bacterium]|nr:class I SAM-dependent methyltransferase [Bryobacterales bacterium]